MQPRNLELVHSSRSPLPIVPESQAHPIDLLVFQGMSPQDAARRGLLKWAQRVKTGGLEEARAVTELEKHLPFLHPYFSRLKVRVQFLEQPTPVFDRKSLASLEECSDLRFPIESEEHRWGYIKFNGAAPSAEYARQDALNELDVWVHFVAQKLDSLLEREKLKRALNGLSKSTGAAVHEVRNPLTSLSLQIHLLTKIFATPSAGESQAFAAQSLLGDMETEIQRIGFHLEDLSLVSQLNAGKFSPRTQKADLVAILAGVVGKFDRIFALRDTRCELSGSPSPLVGLWDPFRIEQVITNLLSNAWKYGAGRPVSVSLDLAEPGSCQLLQPCCLIRVRDAGKGIAKEALKTLFDGFFRADEASSERGSGLGLFVTKSIVTAMGGTIRVESELGKGSEFTVCLPWISPTH